MNKYKNFAKKAYKERHKKRMCLDKKKFINKEDAEKTNDKVYKCPYCNNWHRTTKFKKFINYLKNE